MNILEAVLNAQGGAAAREAGRGLGLSPDQTGSALNALVPALAAGFQRNASQAGGLEALVGALTRGQHSRYLDDPSSLAAPDAVTDGNAILGLVMGAMAKKQLGAGMAEPASADAAGGGLLGMLSPLLDQNRDGSIVDDVLGKFLGGR